MRELVNITYIVYLKNILIYNNNLAKHQYYIREILKYLQQYLLYINLKKYQFNTIEIEFLNFIVSKDKILIVLKKIKIIKK